MKFPTFADDEYVNKYDLLADQGRFNVTGEEADKHLFRVPTLRNVALTAPYFHNGSVKTLDEPVRLMARLQLNKTLVRPRVYPARLGGDKAFPEVHCGDDRIQYDVRYRASEGQEDEGSPPRRVGRT